MIVGVGHGFADFFGRKNKSHAVTGIGKANGKSARDSHVDSTAALKLR